MIRSMTGYSSVRESIADSVVTLEIKTLNNKGYDLHFHASRSLSMLEIPFRERIQQIMRRGRVEVYLRSNGALLPKNKIKVNLDMAKEYMKSAEILSQAMNIEFKPSAELFFNLEGIIEVEEAAQLTEEASALIDNLLNRALDDIVLMKCSEGERLYQELFSILDRIALLIDEIGDLRATVMDEFREKMMARIDEWKQQLELDPNRIIQEVAFYTDRSDIQEEAVRMQSHIQQFRDILNENKPDQPYKPVGRRLDFLCQEMFREVNTIGSKSSAMDIVRHVLDLKSAIEQLREQVQNVE